MNMGKQGDHARSTSSRALSARSGTLPESIGHAGLIAAVVCALAYVLLTFGPDFMMGTSPFWRAENEDITQYVAGFNFYFHAPWQWPLLAFDDLNYPAGTRVTFVDAIPLYALLLKVLVPASAWPFNPYGYWITICYVLQAAGGWWLLRELRIGNWTGLLAFVAVLLTMPILASRTGHISLMSQWMLLFGLALYLRGTRLRLLPQTGWTVLLVAGFYINIYLFVMCGGLYAAACLQARRDAGWRACRWAWLPVLLLALSFFLMLWPLPANNAAPVWGFGYYSMNMLAPWLDTYVQDGREGVLSHFAQIVRGILGGERFRLLDVTPGQYEGLNYLGLGVLLLWVLCARYALSQLGLLGRRHWALCVVLAGYVFYALSDRVMFGSFQVLSFSYPEISQTLTGALRVSGRFFWPVTYALLAAGLVMLWRRHGNTRRFTVIVLMLAALQVWDVWPYHEQLRRYIDRPATTVLSQRQWDAALDAQTEVLYFYPKFTCAESGMGILPLMAYASRTGLKLNTGYISRYAPSCLDSAHEIASSDTRHAAYVFARQAFPDVSDVMPLFSPEWQVDCQQQDDFWLCRAQDGIRP